MDMNYKDDPRLVLCHFNEKHDNKGRFAKKSGGSSANSSGQATKAPKLYNDEMSLRYKARTQDFIADYMDQVSTAGLKKTKNLKKVFGTPSELSYLTETYMSSVGDSDYLGRKIGGVKKQDTNNYIQAGIAITANIVQDYKLAAARSGWTQKQIDEVFDGEFTDKVAKEVGVALGNYYNTQFAGPAPREKYVDKSGATSTPTKRSMSRDDIKKQNPDVPAAAIDVMYKSMNNTTSKKSMRGTTSMPKSTVKHDGIDYSEDPRAVLLHANPYHNPVNGQFTSPGFGMERYVTIDKNGKKVLTEAGKARWEHDKKKNAQKKKDDRVKDENQLIDPHRWVTEDLNSAQKAIENAGQMAKAVRDFEQKKLDQRPRVRKKNLDLSQMTDQELRDKMNRYKLEMDYQNIFNPPVAPEVSKGKKWLMNTLEVAGGVAAVGASAVTIAKAIHDMKKN